MARDKKNIPSFTEPQQQEEMTVVVMRFKGSGESLQRGFDAVSQAIAALGAPQQQRTFTPQPPPAQIAAGQQTIEPGAQSGDGEYIDAEAVAADSPAPSMPKNGSRPPRNKPVYTFMNDFELAPAGVPSLTDYCNEKNPQTVDQKFLVASAWAQKFGGADPFTGGHLFTCFRAMGWGRRRST